MRQAAILHVTLVYAVLTPRQLEGLETKDGCVAAIRRGFFGDTIRFYALARKRQ